MAPEITNVLDGVQLFELPNEKIVLWDHTARGRTSRLHLSLHQKPKVYLKTQFLQWLSSQLETQKNGHLFSQIHGSLSNTSGASSTGVSIMLTQYEGSKIVDKEITVPVAIVRKAVGDFQWSDEQYTDDLQLVRANCRNMHCLDLSQMLTLRIICMVHGIQCVVTVEMASMSTAFVATPIAAVPTLPNQVSKSLTKSKDRFLSTGFLSMDSKRQLVFISETEKNLENLPLIGIWVSGASTVLHPYVWAACVRYLSNMWYKNRLCVPPMPFLLVTYHPNNFQPMFYDCINVCTNSGPAFTSYEAQKIVNLPKVPVMDSKFAFFELLPIEHRCNEFEEAERRIEKDKIDPAPAVIMCNTEDVPEPTHKAPEQIEMRTDPRPLVPNLSLTEEMDVPTNNRNITPESLNRSHPFPPQHFPSHSAQYDAGGPSEVHTERSRPSVFQTCPTAQLPRFPQVETRLPFYSPYDTNLNRSSTRMTPSAQSSGPSHLRGGDFAHTVPVPNRPTLNSMNQNANMHASHFYQSNSMHTSPFMRSSGLPQITGFGMTHGNDRSISSAMPQSQRWSPRSPFHDTVTNPGFSNVNQTPYSSDHWNDHNYGLQHTEDYEPQPHPAVFQMSRPCTMQNIGSAPNMMLPSNLRSLEIPNTSQAVPVIKHQATPMKSCLKKVSSFENIDIDEDDDVFPVPKKDTPKQKQMPKVKEQKKPAVTKPAVKTVSQIVKVTENAIAKIPAKVSHIPVRKKPVQPEADNNMMKLMEIHNNTLISVQENLQKLMLQQNPLKNELPSSIKQNANAENKNTKITEVKMKAQQESQKKTLVKAVDVGKGTKKPTPEVKNDDSNESKLMQTLKEQDKQLEAMKEQIRQLMEHRNSNASNNQKEAIEEGPHLVKKNVCSRTTTVEDQVFENSNNQKTSEVAPMAIMKTTCSMATMTSFIANDGMQNKAIQNTLYERKEHRVKNRYPGPHNGVRARVHQPVSYRPSSEPNIVCHDRENFGGMSLDDMSIKHNFDTHATRSPDPSITFSDVSDFDDTDYSSVCEGSSYAQEKCTNEPEDKTLYRKMLVTNFNGGLAEENDKNHCHPKQKRSHRNMQTNRRYRDDDDSENIDCAYVPQHTNQRPLRKNTEQIAIYQESCIITQTKNCDYEEYVYSSDSSTLSDDDDNYDYAHRRQPRRRDCSDSTYYGIPSTSLSFATRQYLENNGLVNEPARHQQRRHRESQSSGHWIFDKEHRSKKPGHMN